MARLAFALAARLGVRPRGAGGRQGVHVLNVATTSYDPSDFSDVTKLPGILAPVEFFDPLNFAADASESELKRYREAELTHGRVAMLASVGFLVGESGATPLFGGNIDGIAINQFWKVPTGFWPVILLFIAVPETFRALRGWMEPTVPENYFQLRSGYTPGDIDFDPLGLCPADAMEPQTGSTL
ncbi:chlorophyll A-B binding protein [Aureococcus anophagefferens]|nr:chlorophyll A-B binding protein [Aureococcus anophagefferens]